MAKENIEGTATDPNGNPLQDAVIALFLTNKNATDGDINEVQYTRTDSNGNYVIKDHPDADGTSQEWHVAGYYEDGTGEFNALSKPSVEASVGSAIPDSAVGYYDVRQLSFNDGNTVDPLSDDNDNNLSANNTPSYVTDAYAQDAIRLNKANDESYGTTAFSPSNWDGITVGVRFEPLNNTDNVQSIASFGDNNSNVALRSIILDYSGDGDVNDLQLTTNDGSINNKYINDVFSLNTQYTVWLTYDFSNTEANFYFADDSNALLTAEGGLFDPIPNFEFGRSTFNTSRYLDAYFSQLIVAKDVLSQQQRADLHNDWTA